MSLRDLARQDIEDITSNLNEFGLEITFTAPNDQEAVVVGTEAKIHMAIDFETGKEVSAQKASVTIAEKFFIDAGYPVRNAAGSVSMKKHKVDYIDSTGTTCNFEVVDTFPDETVGVIVFYLAERKL
jgi:hypothetical protein